MIKGKTMTTLCIPLAQLQDFDAGGLEIVGLGRCLYDEVYGDDAVLHVWGLHGNAVYHGREFCEIDLSCAATRDRVVRWIAMRIGLAVGSTAPQFGSFRKDWRVTLRHNRLRSSSDCNKQTIRFYVDTARKSMNDWLRCQRWTRQSCCFVVLFDLSFRSRCFF